MCAIFWSIIDMIKGWIPEYNNPDEIAIKSVRQECNKNFRGKTSHTKRKSTCGQGVETDEIYRPYCHAGNL